MSPAPHPKDPPRRVVLARRPAGLPVDADFRLEEVPPGALADGQVRVAVEHLSIDAFIRTVLEEKSYHPSVPIGGTVAAFGVGRVLESRSPALAPGDAVSGAFGAQTHAVVPAALCRRHDAGDLPLRAHLGVLGLTTGVTAWVGMREIGRVQPGETVVVSAAAGAVGGVAAQIAKLDGGRVIGIAGGPEKAHYLTGELGLDGAVDYKRDDVADQLRALAPAGVDVFFDNVGGEILDVVLDQLAERARIVLCGAISQYQHMGEVRGPSLYLRLAERQARMEGFAVTHFPGRFAQAEAELARWLAEGRIALREHVEAGLERFPTALRMLFTGGHVGKLLVAVGDGPGTSGSSLG